MYVCVKCESQMCTAHSIKSKHAKQKAKTCVLYYVLLYFPYVLFSFSLAQKNPQIKLNLTLYSSFLFSLHHCCISFLSCSRSFFCSLGSPPFSQFVCMYHERMMIVTTMVCIQWKWYCIFECLHVFRYGMDAMLITFGFSGQFSLSPFAE